MSTAQQIKYGFCQTPRVLAWKWGMLQISTRPQRNSADKIDLCQEEGGGGQSKLYHLAFLLNLPRLSWGHGRRDMQEKTNGGKFLQIMLHK